MKSLSLLATLLILTSPSILKAEKRAVKVTFSDQEVKRSPASQNKANPRLQKAVNKHDGQVQTFGIDSQLSGIDDEDPKNVRYIE